MSEFDGHISTGFRRHPIMVDLTVVVVSWNVITLLRDCLRSVASDLGCLSSETIVVDNASADDSAAMVRAEFPEVTLIVNTDNFGFARANNQAIRASSGRYVVLLNSDTIVPPGALETLVAFLDAHPEAGVVGPRLLRPDGTAQPYAFGGDPTLGYLLRRGINRLIFQRPLHDWTTDTVQQVDWVSGACLMVRREAIDRAGLLDESIFMYFEDNDWCLRIRQAGWHDLLQSPGRHHAHRRAKPGTESGCTAGVWRQPALLIRQALWPASVLAAQCFPSTLPPVGQAIGIAARLTMLSRLTRSLYSRRTLLKRLIFIRRPILLNLPGFKIYVRLNDWAVGARIAVKGRYEAHVTGVMTPFLQPGRVVIDIGANIGYYTLLAASHVGERGKVIAFEPGADNCALLRKSLLANGFHNVVLHSCAVADIDGMVGFGMDDSNGQITRDNPPVGSQQVRSVTLDAFLADEPRIDLIKMDVEGAEGRALQGMRRLLQRHHPVVFTEFTPAALPRISGMLPEAFLDQLRGLEYELFILSRDCGLSGAAQSNTEIMAYFSGSETLDHLDLLARPTNQPN